MPEITLYRYRRSLQQAMKYLYGAQCAVNDDDFAQRKFVKAIHYMQKAHEFIDKAEKIAYFLNEEVPTDE